MILAAIIAAQLSGVGTGTGVLCDTAAQAREFVERVSSGGDPQQVLKSVNVNAEKDNACGVVTMAYERVREVEQFRGADDVLVAIIEIQVIGVRVQDRLQPIDPPQTQYIALPVKETKA